MSSGYERIDPRQMQRLSQGLTEAPAFDQFAPMQQQQPRRRDAQRVLERELQNINTPLPPGVEENIRRLQRMQRFVPQEFRLPDPPPGQGPHQVEPDPLPPAPPAPLRSVLRRDNMG